jgi:molybdopterin molybdotransferase
MLTYREALDQILVLPLEARPSRAPLLGCTNRILCEPVRSPWPLPRFDQSAMDGFALARCEGASPYTLVGESAAGRPFDGALSAGQAIRISTGAQLPTGADTVVPREVAEITADGKLLPKELPTSGHYIRRRGEDVGEGQELFATGTRLDSTKVAFLSMFNLANLPVWDRPRVAVLGSGNEVKLLGEPLGVSDIVGSNLYYLAGELASFGCETRMFGVARDKAESFRDLLAESLAWADLVISTAGVSVGDHDVVGHALEMLGAQVHFWRVAVRPGKPMLVATVHGKMFFGLPGNPVSTVCNTEIFVKPFLRRHLRIEPAERPLELMRLASDCPRDRHRLFFVNAQCRLLDGTWTVEPLAGQSSGNLYNAARSNGLIVLEPGVGPVPRGETVKVLRVRTGE